MITASVLEVFCENQKIKEILNNKNNPEKCLPNNNNKRNFLLIRNEKKIGKSLWEFCATFQFNLNHKRNEDNSLWIMFPK